MLEKLKTELDLSTEGHTAKGGSQIRGASGNAVRRVVQAFGETRPFGSEGGHTNRGLRGDIDRMHRERVKFIPCARTNVPQGKLSFTPLSL